MSDVTPIPPPAEGEDILAYTREIRLKLVNHLTSGGTSMPTASEEVYPLLSTLKDLDAQDLALKKLKQDDSNANADRRVSLMIAEFASRVQGNPFEHVVPPTATREVVVEEALLGDYTAVPGETEQGTVGENLQEFMKKREGG